MQLWIFTQHCQSRNLLLLEKLLNTHYTEACWSNCTLLLLCICHRCMRWMSLQGT